MQDRKVEGQPSGLDELDPGFPSPGTEGTSSMLKSFSGLESSLPQPDHKNRMSEHKKMARK